MLGDHILDSHDFADREGVATKRNLTLITIGAKFNDLCFVTRLIGKIRKLTVSSPRFL